MVIVVINQGTIQLRYYSSSGDRIRALNLTVHTYDVSMLVVEGTSLFN